MAHSSLSYNTKSNKVRVIKTPGGKLRYLHIKKKGSPPKCGDCGIKLPGVSFLPPFAPIISATDIYVTRDCFVLFARIKTYLDADNTSFCRGRIVPWQPFSS
jgi:ribosomal protein L34E